MVLELCDEIATKTNFNSSNVSSLISSSSQSAGLLPTPSFNHLINMKLNKDNYFLWKALLLPYLCSQGLLGYVDGSKPSLAKFVAHTSSDGAAQVLNPEYITWYQQDQFVLSALLLSLSKEVLSYEILLSTS